FPARSQLPRFVAFSRTTYGLLSTCLPSLTTAGDKGTIPATWAKLRNFNQEQTLIDDNTFLYRVLLVRGTARLEAVDGVVLEYATAAERYFGSVPGRAMVPDMVRMTVTPEWMGWLDFQMRFPSALSA